MEQIISYAAIFLALVVSAVDTLTAWLAEHGFSSGILIIAIIGAYAFRALNKWLFEIEERLQDIELKLSIERTARIEKKYPWWTLLAWFVFAVYLLGKSIQAEGSLAFAAGIALSGFMLLICAFAAYCFVDQVVRDYGGKKGETQDEDKD
jgi:hypothetical protein